MSIIVVTHYTGTPKRCWRAIAETCMFSAAIEVETPLSRYWFCRFHLGMVARGDMRMPRGEDPEAFREALQEVVV